jgi:hypothetical protein
MSDKTQVPKQSSILAASGLNSKSITGVNCYQIASMTVIEISFSGGSQFIKVKQHQVEVGGTSDWDTGSKVIF